MLKKLLTVVALVALAFSLLTVNVSAVVIGPTVVLTNNINGRTTVKDADTVIITAIFAVGANLTLDATLPNQPKISISGTAVANADMTVSDNPLVWNYSWDVPAGNIPEAGVSITAKDSDGNASQTPIGITTYKVENMAPSLTISSFSVTPDTGFDPSSSGQNEDLAIAYIIAEVPDSVSIKITNEVGATLKTFSGVEKNGNFSWDGEYNGKLVEPGTYKVDLTASKANYTSTTQQKTVLAEYANANKPTISSFTVSPTSFNPDEIDMVIGFKNDKASYLTVEIRNANGEKVRGFTDYENDSFTADDVQSISWDGLNDSGSKVAGGTYKTIVIARNEYGVSVYQENVIVLNSGGTIPSSNSHISGVNLDPSSKFEPAEDDEIQVEFDVLKDLDELKIYAVRGSDEIELYSETDVTSENNLEITWDGTNDSGDYVAGGTWRIEFRSKLAGDSLKASKSIEVSYAKPNIDDLYVSKDKFDNDRSEFTYAMFKVDDDALVDVNVLEGGDKDDTLTEDLEVVKNKWYAVQFDGGSYEYDDSLSLEIVAKNKVNEDIYSTKKISVDLAEDDVSSNKSNVTNDYVSPVLTNGNTEMELAYDLEETADVVITIHKGKSSTGTKMIELADLTDQESGSHSIIWNGKDDDGKKFANGIYTYKIISKLSSTDTEVGYFVVGTVGDIEGDVSGGGTNTGTTTGGSTNPNVIIDGQSTGGTSGTGNCDGFTDVISNSGACEAIKWTQSAGIFQGYEDGTFKPFAPISRTEVLKVVLKSAAIAVDQSNTSSYGLGFNDIINGAWYIPYIRTAKSLGIFSGDAGKSTARPNDDVSRAEVLKLVFESLRVSNGYSLSTCSLAFTDTLTTSWYFKYACASKTYSLFTSGAVLNPDVSATRSEVASVLYKLHTAGVL